jgi:hypothetical protein
MVEDLFTNISNNFIATGIWKIIGYFIKNYKRIQKLLLDIFNIFQKKFHPNIYHDNTPLTYIGNGKFGDHL